jgi:hypothetical protein
MGGEGGVAEGVAEGSRQDAAKEAEKALVAKEATQACEGVRRSSPSRCEGSPSRCEGSPSRCEGSPSRCEGAPPLGVRRRSSPSRWDCGWLDGWTSPTAGGGQGRGSVCISATSCTQTSSAAGPGQASRMSTEMGECVHAQHGFILATVRFMQCRVRRERARTRTLY